MGKMLLEQIKGICVVLQVLLTQSTADGDDGSVNTWLSGTGVMFSRGSGKLEHADLGLGL